MQHLVGRHAQHVAVDHGHARDLPVLRDRLDLAVERLAHLARALDEVARELAHLGVLVLLLDELGEVREVRAAHQVVLVEVLQGDLTRPGAFFHRRVPSARSVATPPDAVSNPKPARRGG